MSALTSTNASQSKTQVMSKDNLRLKSWLCPKLGAHQYWVTHIQIMSQDNFQARPCVQKV